MGWRADSSAGAFTWDTEPMTPAEVACRDEEIRWLMDHERRNWTLINGRLVDSGAPLAMSQGAYAGPGAIVLPAALPGVALSTTEASLIGANVGIYTPIPANTNLSPQGWRIWMAARYTVTTTPGTCTFSPRLGNANTSPSLGTSAAITLTASLTNAFILFTGGVTIQSLGAPGTNSKALGMFEAKVNTAVGGAFNTAVWGTAAGTAVSYDSTIALGTNGGGLWVGSTDAGATNHATITVDQIHWSSWG